MILVNTEIRQFGSRNLDQSPMYPGKWRLTWIKAPYMPWVLANMEPAGELNEEDFVKGFGDETSK